MVHFEQGTSTITKTFYSPVLKKPDFTKYIVTLCDSQIHTHIYICVCIYTYFLYSQANLLLQNVKSTYSQVENSQMSQGQVVGVRMSKEKIIHNISKMRWWTNVWK
jgi:hypothetical protein